MSQWEFMAITLSPQGPSKTRTDFYFWFKLKSRFGPITKRNHNEEYPMACEDSPSIAKQTKEKEAKPECYFNKNSQPGTN